jgi:hypothetical protein
VRAAAGDWLVVKSRTDHTTARRASIIAVLGADGAPPYRVRWLDDDHEGLVFPGPDAVVVTAAEQSEIDRVAEARLRRVQEEIAAEARPRAASRARPRATRS